MRLILGHVKGKCIPDEEFEVVSYGGVGGSVVTAITSLLPHLEDAHRARDDITVAKDILILSVVEVLVLIEVFEFLDDPLEDLSSLLDSAVGTGVASLVDVSFALLVPEVSIAEHVQPFFAASFVALHPLPMDLSHADHAVLVVLEVFIALKAEHTLLTDHVLLVLETTQTHLALQATLASVLHLLYLLGQSQVLDLPQLLVHALQPAT